MRGAVAALVGLALVACGPREAPVTLEFEARVGDAAFACGQTYGEGAGAWSPTDLRLFVHDLRVVTAAGQEVPVRLDDDGAWQDGRVALLDFEDGTGACANGTRELRTTVAGKAASRGRRRPCASGSACPSRRTMRTRRPRRRR